MQPDVRLPTASSSGWLAFSTHTVLLPNGCDHIQRKYASLPLSDAEHNLSSRDSPGLCGGLCVPSGIRVDLKSEKPSNSFDCDFSASGVGFIYLFIFSEALLQSYVLLALQQKRATKEV